MEFIKAFVAGFVSTLLFHQGVLALLHATGVSPKAPFDMTATAPLQVPAVISLAFWGGLWGIAIWLAIRGAPDLRYWMLAIALGALGPSIVALFVVFPAKGMPVAGGGSPKVIGPVLEKRPPGSTWPAGCWVWRTRRRTSRRSSPRPEPGFRTWPRSRSTWPTSRTCRRSTGCTSSSCRSPCPVSPPLRARAAGPGRQPRGRGAWRGIGRKAS